MLGGPGASLTHIVAQSLAPGPLLLARPHKQSPKLAWAEGPAAKRTPLLLLWLWQPSPRNKQEFDKSLDHKGLNCDLFTKPKHYPN